MKVEVESLQLPIVRMKYCSQNQRTVVYVAAAGQWARAENKDKSWFYTRVPLNKLRTRCWHFDVGTCSVPVKNYLSRGLADFRIDLPGRFLVRAIGHPLIWNPGFYAAVTFFFFFFFFFFLLFTFLEKNFVPPHFSVLSYATVFCTVIFYEKYMQVLKY